MAPNPPTLTPMRNSIRLSFAISALRATIRRWMSTAQRTASTALLNSANSPSPVFLTTRPRCSAIFGFTREDRCSLSWTCVPSSSKPVKRLYPATSAARMAVSRRSKCSEAKFALRTACAQFTPTSKIARAMFGHNVSGLGQSVSDGSGGERRGALLAHSGKLAKPLPISAVATMSAIRRYRGSERDRTAHGRRSNATSSV
jgi:hypothetical protein